MENVALSYTFFQSENSSEMLYESETTRFSNHQVKNTSCSLYQAKYRIYSCQTYRILEIAVGRVHIRANKLCINCLSSGHILKNCNSNSFRRVFCNNHHTMFHSTTQQYHSSFTTQQDTGSSQQRYARPNANRLASHWGNRAAIPFLIAMRDTGSYSSSTRNSLGLFHRQLHSKTLGLIQPLSYCQIPVLVQLEPMNETIDIIHIQPIWETHGQLLCKDSLTPQVYKSRCFQALSLLNVNRCDQCCQPQFLPTKRQFVNLWPHNFMNSKSKALKS